MNKEEIIEEEDWDNLTDEERHLKDLRNEELEETI